MPWVIGENYCQVVPFGPPYASGYLKCRNGELYFYGFTTNDCSGDGDIVPGMYAYGGATDGTCMGHGDYCDVIWMTYYEESAMGDSSWSLSYEECEWKAAANGTARFAVPMDTCWNASNGTYSKSFTCDANLTLTIDIYNGSSCAWDGYLGADLLTGLDIYNNDTSTSCVYAWRENGEPVCQEPYTTPEPTTTESMSLDISGFRVLRKKHTQIHCQCRSNVPMSNLESFHYH